MVPGRKMLAFDWAIFETGYLMSSDRIRTKHCIIRSPKQTGLCTFEHLQSSFVSYPLKASV